MDHLRPLPSFAEQLLEVFEGPLRDVQFPDVDRSILAASIEDVRAAEDEVTRAEEALAAARTARDDKQKALSARAERGFAYARVYAEDTPDLSAALEAMAPRAAKRAPRASREVAAELPESGPSTAPPRKPRVKRGSGSDSLFEPEGAAGVQAAE